MAVFILISGIMGVFAVAVGWYLYLPVVIELFNLPQWSEAPTEALLARDRILQFIYLFPVLMLGWIVVWGYLKASKSSVEFS